MGRGLDYKDNFPKKTYRWAEACEKIFNIISNYGNAKSSLVIQWLRICLQMQGTLVQSMDTEMGSHIPRGN